MILRVTNNDFEQAQRIYKTMDVEDFNLWLYKKSEMALKEKQKENVKKMFSEM